MIKKLIESGRINITVLLFLLSVFSFSLTIFRIYYSGSMKFISLNWNLFLAFIPWLLSSVIILKNLHSNKFLLTLLMFTWILFFPNSPYILTDLFHLSLYSNVPVWYDLVMILSFALTGLLFGFLSLIDMERILSRFLSRRLIVFVIVSFLFVSGFGVYVGRYLRWNSWNLINHPLPLLKDLYYNIANPFANPKSWAITILFGILLNLLYFSFKFIKVPKE